MSEAVEALILDLLAHVATGTKTYAETMDAWRTSCPRLPVWEEANDRGLLTRGFENGEAVVRITQAGRALLDEHLVRNGAAKRAVSRAR